jgi:outer membrane protein OmpA-like peptidoglycan-associated protein
MLALGLASSCTTRSGWYMVSRQLPQPATARPGASSEAAGLTAVIESRLDQQVAELSRIARARRTLDGLVCDSEKLLFAPNSARLTPAGRRLLTDAAQIISKYPEDFILVGGHCDATGTDDGNRQLSARRAIAAADVLIDDGVLPMESVRVLGFGATRPAAPNDTAEGRRLNRRVELIITVDKARVASIASG